MVETALTIIGTKNGTEAYQWLQNIHQPITKNNINRPWAAANLLETVINSVSMGS